MSEAKTIGQAFADWQAEMPNVSKDRQGQGYRYAGLPELLSAAVPVLRRHGLAVTWRTRGDELGGVEVACVLLHPVSGGEMEASLRFPRPRAEEKRMSDLQSLAAAITHGKRLTLLAVLGWCDGVDVDSAGVAAPFEWRDELEACTRRIESCAEVEDGRRIARAFLQAMRTEQAGEADLAEAGFALRKAGEALAAKIDGGG